MFYLIELVVKAYIALLKWTVRSVARLLQGIGDSFLWAYDSIREKPSRLIAVLSVFLPIGTLILLAPREWFINWPVMFATALALYGALKSPLASAPSFLRKLIQVGMAACLFMGWSMLLRWRPLLNMLRLTVRGTLYPWLIGLVCFWAAVVWITLHDELVTLGALAGIRPMHSFPRGGRTKRISFRDVGGMEEAKQQIRELVESKLKPGKYRKYGVERNGILLYGPQGSGKTFLAEATAGEFRLNYHYVSLPQVESMWHGETGNNLRKEFREASSRKPVLLYLDEIDSLGSGRQTMSGKGDPSGSGREFNNITITLMQCIDRYRSSEGFVLMAATNLLDGLDPALIREGRFDLRVRVDLPDEAGRFKILQSQLSGKPCNRFDLLEFARRTPGMSAAKLKALVDSAASLAATQGRRIEAADLRQALTEIGGRDRPLVQPVQWEDVVVEEDVERDLRTLVRLLGDPDAARRIGLPMPTGLLLLGPPGTGKTMLGRLIATQTRRSFYPITSADVLGGNVGDSVKRISQIFARAKENGPSIIFIDEMDGLMPRAAGLVGQHDIQVTEQFMIEISSLHPEQNVFLVGTTNHPDHIDPRVLRGGRFSEKIEIGLPGRPARERLLERYLAGAPLAPDTSIGILAERLRDLSPADLEAITNTARRFAFNRAPDSSQLPPLILADFDKAVQRVRGTVLQA